MLHGKKFNTLVLYLLSSLPSFLCPNSFYLSFYTCQNLIIYEKKQYEALKVMEVLMAKNDNIKAEREGLIHKVNELDAYTNGLNKTLHETRGALQIAQGSIVDSESNLKKAVEVITRFETPKLEWKEKKNNWIGQLKSLRA